MLAAGIWSRQIGGLAVVSAVPHTVKHQYVISEKNAGVARAHRSTTVFYLSPSQHLGAHPIRLGGVARIGALNAKATAQVTARLTVPRSVPPRSYSLIACANSGHSVSESKAGNDCRASHRRTAVTTGSKVSTTTTVTTTTAVTTTTQSDTAAGFVRAVFLANIRAGSPPTQSAVPGEHGDGAFDCP